MQTLLLATEATQPNLTIPNTNNTSSPVGDVLVSGSIAAGVSVFVIKEIIKSASEWWQQHLELTKSKEAAEIAEDQADRSMLQEMIRDLREQNKVLRDQNQTLVLEMCNLRRMMDMSGPLLEPSTKSR